MLRSDIAGESAVMMLSDVDFDELACEICSSPDDEDSMLLCGKCEKGFHMACLSPPLSALPEEEWLCEDCWQQLPADDVLRMLLAGESSNTSPLLHRAHVLCRGKGRVVRHVACETLAAALPTIVRVLRKPEDPELWSEHLTAACVLAALCTTDEGVETRRLALVKEGGVNALLDVANETFRSPPDEWSESLCGAVCEAIYRACELGGAGAYAACEQAFEAGVVDTLAEIMSLHDPTIKFGAFQGADTALSTLTYFLRELSYTDQKKARRYGLRIIESDIVELLTRTVRERPAHAWPLGQNPLDTIAKLCGVPCKGGNPIKEEARRRTLKAGVLDLLDVSDEAVRWALGDPRAFRGPTANPYANLPTAQEELYKVLAQMQRNFHLLALSHDELGVIVDGLADPLQPVVAVTFSSTCKGLRKPLQAALGLLQQRHSRAVALCLKICDEGKPMSCAELQASKELDLGVKNLTPDDMAALGMLLGSNFLPELQFFDWNHNPYGDAGAQAMFERMDHGSLPTLVELAIEGVEMGLAGSKALAAALSRGAMPNLQYLYLEVHPIGNQSVAALAAPLRKMPTLKVLSLVDCQFGNKGMASLFANLSKDEFKALEHLYLHGNPISAAGVDQIVVAIEAGGLPKLNSPDRSWVNSTGEPRPVGMFTNEFTDEVGLSASEARVASALAKRSSSQLRKKTLAMSLSDVDDLACEICRSPDDEASMLLCGKCERGFHMACLSPPLSALPEEEWLCKNCGSCLLLNLSHDELGVIFDGLADPLQPVVAVALSSTCKGLRTPLRAALQVLKERHARAAALCRKVPTADMDAELNFSTVEFSCAKLRDAEDLNWTGKGLTTEDMATLNMILCTNGLPRLQRLSIYGNGFGDAGMQALCEGHFIAASLIELDIEDNDIGPAGAEALAAALHRGAMPKLKRLILTANPLGNQGVTSLTLALRKLPALKELRLTFCEIGDEGLSSLFANLGKDDFKALERLDLGDTDITDAGMTTLVAALDAGGLPKLINCDLSDNEASTSAVQAVHDALAKR